MVIPQSRLTNDLFIHPMLNGMWQVSGGHGRIEPGNALRNMLAYHKAGFTTWDLADHYGPAEALIGAFRQTITNRYGTEEAHKIQAFTKWVPRPGTMTRSVVERAVITSCRRMKSDYIDLLQFHWWDYRDERYYDALRHLMDLRQEGKIRHLGLTNFDTATTQKVVNNDIKIITNQVQYSLIDQRPATKMTHLCRRHHMKLLGYGTLCGGFLSDRFLNKPEPVEEQLSTVSLKKYKRIIDAWGGWELFQWLLRTLRVIADRQNASIANIAVRAILDKPAVAGVIIGSRLGLSDNREDNQRTFDIALEPEDCRQIASVLSQANNLHEKIGDCGDEYRRHW